MRLRISTVAIAAGLLLLVACGSDQNSNLPTIGGTPVSLSMTDAPPSGVTVLSFEVTLTSAVLQSAPGGPGNFSLLQAPIEIEVKKLETETAFLNTSAVPPGTYNGIVVGFSNPEITILNNSGSSIAGCANGAVCELRPPLSSGTISFSGPPFPLTIVAGQPIGLVLDLDVNNSIQSGFAINPAISFVQSPVLQPTGQIEEIEDLTGRVTGKDPANNQFTLQIRNGQSLTIRVDGNTEFEDFDEMALANSFASLATGQIVEVDLRLMAGGMLVAKKVELEQEEADEQELEGTVVSIDLASNPPRLQMVITEEEPDVPGIDVGNLATVIIQNGAQFRVDNDGLEVSSSLFFASPADLLAGQNIQVRLRSGSAGTSIVTDRVRLRRSRFTANVKSKAGDTFIVDNLPSIFTSANPAITEIEVRTSEDTNFNHVANLAALNTGDRVSLRGLLFKTAGNPVLVAGKVRLRRP
ncbi:MAG: DUF5666 domain-containing protein [Acidobacteriales bacterium]|nr:DUF5666 domain-containing protein [Terriglobales bacterium]